ncbi:MAG: circularly permuted type 2 ATP-grasp protein [Oceanicaulis sp.]
MAGSGLFDTYDASPAFCEVTGRRDDPEIQRLFFKRLARQTRSNLARRKKRAEEELFNLGITFTVYFGEDTVDRVLPFDVIPRPITAPDWADLEAGVVQRIAALNAFLHDIYHDQKILKDGVVPAELVTGNKYFLKEMMGVDLPHRNYVHICGTDMIRDVDGSFLVLEDNCRAPSGVSYVIENRHLMQRSFPDLMENAKVRPVSDYGMRLREKLTESAPAGVDDPKIVLMTPGLFNSAYFEHVFLAREMGVPLVEGRDLFVDEDDAVYMKTVSGPEPVHVIYRRIDDAFLDPEVFRKESMLGTPGLMRAMKAGKVTIANAPGTGVADDKAVYAYMPEIVRYYLSEEPILKNVHTHICRREEDRKFVLDNLADLVVKPVGESGGYGIVVGPKSTKAEREEVARAIKRDPDNYIAQPMITLSACPTLTSEGVAPRHVDLRPFAVTGKDTFVLPGGLTRVAMKKGSIIVNSSQGGGSKDTWVLS